MRSFFAVSHGLSQKIPSLKRVIAKSCLRVGIYMNGVHLVYAHLLKLQLVCAYFYNSFAHWIFLVQPLVCAQIISKGTTRLRTHFSSHFYRLRTVSEYFNFTGVVKNVFFVYYIVWYMLQIIRIFRFCYFYLMCILCIFKNVLLQWFALEAVTHLFQVI
jgi:hypothetical protein